MSDDLIVEGLAGQLYASNGPGYFAWWHVASEEAKERWRAAARKKIAEFTERNAVPWDTKP